MEIEIFEFYANRVFIFKNGVSKYLKLSQQMIKAKKEVIIEAKKDAYN